MHALVSLKRQTCSRDEPEVSRDPWAIGWLAMVETDALLHLGKLDAAPRVALSDVDLLRQLGCGNNSTGFITGPVHQDPALGVVVIGQQGAAGGVLTAVKFARRCGSHIASPF